MQPRAVRVRDTLTPRMLAALVAVGVLAGAAGIALTLLLHLVQHLAFGYTENTFLIGVERAPRLRRVLAVGIGGLLVGLGWWGVHRRTGGHGADLSVTGALRGKRTLPIGPAVVDAGLQVVAVGVGASLGREGAPRQVGAALAGWASRRIGVTPAQQRILLACGAGAGLAAVYNVPVGGAVFTVEVLLASIAVEAVIPAAVTSVIATTVAWPVLGHHPTYHPAAAPFALSLLAWSVPFGAVAGAVGTGVARLSTVARRHAPGGWWAVLATAAVFTGLGGLAVRYPALLGNGKGMAELAFTGSVGAGIAAPLAVLKPLATAACLGAGAIGGLLTPSLATGSAVGLVTGAVWVHLWSGSTPAAFALVGAAAVLAAAQRAPWTAVVLLFDFTHVSPVLAAPVIVAVAGATLTRHLIDDSWVKRGLTIRGRHPTGTFPSG